MLFGNIPPICQRKGPFILSFTLGDDIYLRSVLGLPTLLYMCTTIDLQRDSLACSELQHTFASPLTSLGKGFPDGFPLDESKPFIPPGVYFLYFICHN